MFFKGSRYADVGEDKVIYRVGREILYKKVRFIPETAPQQGHIVSQGERLDNIAHSYFRDAERFWRICDANRTMWPDDLLAHVGRKILIPASEG